MSKSRSHSAEYEDLKELIKSVLISNKQAMNISEFKKFYKEVIGTDVNFVQFGFNCLESLLFSMTDVVSASTYRGQHMFRGIADDKTKHIQNLVSGQKSNTAKRKPPRFNVGSSFGSRNPPGRRSFPVSSYGGSGMYGSSSSYKAQKPLLPAYDKSTQNWQSSSGYRNDYSQSGQQGNDLCQAMGNMNINKPRDSIALQELKSRLSPQLGRRVGIEGASNIANRPGSLQHKESSERFNQYQNHSTTLKKGVLEKHAIERLKSILEFFPEGISAKKLAEKYMEEFPSFVSEIDWKGMGYRTFTDLILASPLDSFCMKNLASTMFLFPSLSKSNNQSSQNEIPTRAEAASCVDEDEQLENKEDSFRVDASIAYTPVEVPEIGCWFKCVVGEIFSPYKFFLIIFSAEYSQKLDELSNEMQEFYNENLNNEWRMNPRDIVPEQKVVVIYEEEDSFNRGIITEVINIDYVMVLCVDYGTILKVRKNRLWYLHKDFFELPTQAIYVKLNGIRKIIDKVTGKASWAKNTSQYFKKLTESRILDAQIEEIEIKNESQVCSISLRTTGTETDFSIADRLISLQYVEKAEVSPSKNIPHTSTENLNIRHSPDGNEQEDYSHFQDDENSNTPTTIREFPISYSKKEETATPISSKSSSLSIDQKVNALNTDAYAKFLDLGQSPSSIPATNTIIKPETFTLDELLSFNIKRELGIDCTNNSTPKMEYPLPPVQMEIPPIKVEPHARLSLNPNASEDPLRLADSSLKSCLSYLDEEKKLLIAKLSESMDDSDVIYEALKKLNGLIKSVKDINKDLSDLL